MALRPIIIDDFNTGTTDLLERRLAGNQFFINYGKGIIKVPGAKEGHRLINLHVTGNTTGHKLVASVNKGLWVSGGYKVSMRVELAYGADTSYCGTSLKLNILPFNEFQIDFDGSDKLLNFNLQLRSGSGYRQYAENIIANELPFSTSVPISAFAAATHETFNPESISSILFIFQHTGPALSNDFGVRRIILK